ncbi:MAG: peptidase, partial [Bacteroidota bacterium]
SNAHITQIGDTTAGDLSDVSNRHFLPNGWSYQFSHQMYLLPDGTSLDGIGHIPDVYIKNEKSDIETGNDLVLERAFEYLFETYGIE